MSDSQKYDTRTIWFHWLSAGLIVTLWGLAQIIDWFARPDRVWPRTLHIALGLTLVAVYVARVIWRVSSGRRLPMAETGVLGLVGKAAHYGLYALVAVTLGLGLYYEAMRGDSIAHLFRLPQLIASDQAARGAMGEWHGTAANAILILAGLHGAAALYHYIVRRDRVLQRMV